MQTERTSFSSICVKKMGSLCRREKKKGRVLLPRSSSPHPVFVDKVQCVVEQAFETIEWDDLEDCASVLRRESDSLGSQVNESDGDDQYFGEYALDFIAETSDALESSLSPVALLPFHGCVIPPLTPRQDPPPQDCPAIPSPEPGPNHAEDMGSWRGATSCHQDWLLHDAAQVNRQLHENLRGRREEVESLQERNVHLRELASRAKHLASVLEKLMTVRDLSLHEASPPSCEQTSGSPCKRRRLSGDRGADPGGSSAGSVEDMLRDISTRCDAVLLGRNGGAEGSGQPQDEDSVRMYGAFAGLPTSVAKGPRGTGGAAGEGASAARGCDASFRTSIQDHCTIRTQVFPHGHAFTSRTETGGHRFRWVPHQS